MALICDDQLFIKPTQAGRDYLGEPYTGAKPYFRVDGDRWDDADWLAGLVKATADDLPVPKPKKAKKG